MGRRESLEPRAAARRIVDRLAEAGHVAYFAGGCVRDELLGLEPKDYDVATDAPPDTVEGLFRRTREVGKSFGVVLVREGGVEVEVATFRSEGAYSDRRRPDHVRFSTPEEDASRRDFTINALFIDPRDEAGRAGGRVIDLVGGVADLEARVVRAVGDPEERLAEDHLRALRAARFTARLGFALDPPTAAAVHAHARDLEGVSRERVGDELRRMMAHPTRAAAAGLLHELGLDGPSLGEEAMGAIPTPRLASLPPRASAGDGLAAWMLDREAARTGGRLDGERLHGLGREIVRGWRRALCLSNDEAHHLRAVADTLAALIVDWPGLRDAKRMRLASRPTFAVALLLLAADREAEAGEIRGLVEDLASRPGGLAPPPLLNGDDLIGLGLRPGPRFAGWLERIYDAQLEGEAADRDAAIALARRLAADEDTKIKE